MVSLTAELSTRSSQFSLRFKASRDRSLQLLLLQASSKERSFVAGRRRIDAGRRVEGLERDGESSSSGGVLKRAAPSFFLSFLLSFLPSFFPSFFLSFLLSFLPSFFPSFFLSFLRTYGWRAPFCEADFLAHVSPKGYLCGCIETGEISYVSPVFFCPKKRPL